MRMRLFAFHTYFGVSVHPRHYVCLPYEAVLFEPAQAPKRARTKGNRETCSRNLELPGACYVYCAHQFEQLPVFLAYSRITGFYFLFIFFLGYIFFLGPKMAFPAPSWNRGVVARKAVGRRKGRWRHLYGYAHVLRVQLRYFCGACSIPRPHFPGAITSSCCALHPSRPVVSRRKSADL